MSKIRIENINLGKLEGVLEQYENKWVAISDENKVVASGSTYKETVERADNNMNTVLFKVPPLSASLAP